MLWVVVIQTPKNKRSKSSKIRLSIELRKLLKKYANGQALGSEVTSFEYIVKEVRKTDAARGDALEKGFAGPEKLKGAALSAKAKELLKAIAPQPGYPGS